MLSLTALLKGLPQGFEATAIDIAAISGANRVMGIHPLADGDRMLGVVLLCTINGEHYPNAWIEPGRILKYYFYGITVDGKKRFSPTYKYNQAVINSERGNYPLFVFVREEKVEKFSYAGEFRLLGTSMDDDGSMFFILGKEAKDQEDIISTVIQDSENFPEGRVVERIHKYRERNPSLVHAAKKAFESKHGSVYCEACGFDFVEVYGERGRGFIEVHHNVPLSELKVEQCFTAIDEVSLVCSNCHSIIHRTRPWLSVEQVAEIVRASRTSSSK
ncbi:MAG: hypothetical protein GX182_01375 [Firmicutes bacterium]|nr:hypothetical protein [Bacillota bacterium]